MGAAVFKTVERQSLSLVGSIPIRLRHQQFCPVRRPLAGAVDGPNDLRVPFACQIGAGRGGLQPWPPNADTSGVGFLVTLAVALSLQLVLIVPAGRVRFRRLVPRWLRVRIGFFLMFGLPVVAGGILAGFSSLGEGAVLAFTDVLAVGLIVAAMSAVGFAGGHIDEQFTDPAPKANPWVLLSLRDRYKIKKALRRGVFPEDEALIAAAAEWTEAVAKDPSLNSPRQLERAQAVTTLLSQIGARMAHSVPGVLETSPEPSAG